VRQSPYSVQSDGMALSDGQTAAEGDKRLAGVTSNLGNTSYDSSTLRRDNFIALFEKSYGSLLLVACSIYDSDGRCFSKTTTCIVICVIVVHISGCGIGRSRSNVSVDVDRSGDLALNLSFGLFSSGR